ncbi:zinc-ribbon domain-containing protein [Paracoccus sanguinis]|uniref:zinc-ribbon domain-containing protein n=1 Tax=Paracoccus sanguinis TaxID=1545044 RepID=UPI001B3B35A3|nr:zinc-ribbon domain-containing protein [Paracoccus sanguinis]
MRLVCPRCGAQYEIDAEAIPARGRDVECSACEHVWRAYPAGFDPAARPALSRPLDESVIEILRGEAARELEARAAEREAERATARTAAALARHATPDTTLPGDAPETPAEGLVVGPSRDADPAGAGAVPEGIEPAPVSAAPSTLPAALTPAARPSAPPAASPLDVPPAADATDGDLTLSPDPRSPDSRGTAPSDPPPHTTEAPASTAAHTSAPLPNPAPRATRRPPPAVTRAARARRRHDAGYHLAVMVALVAVTLYALAPRMADQGALGTTLMSWRAQVDEGRIWLDTQADALVARVRGAL